MVGGVREGDVAGLRGTGDRGIGRDRGNGGGTAKSAEGKEEGYGKAEEDDREHGDMA